MQNYKIHKVRPKACFLLDSDSKNKSYDILNELKNYEDNSFDIFIGCTNDPGIDTFKLAKKAYQSFSRDRIHLFPGKIKQAPAAIFCKDTLTPEIVLGENKDKVNKYSTIGKILLKMIGLRTQDFKYLVVEPNTSVSERVGVYSSLGPSNLDKIVKESLKDSKKIDSYYIEAGSGSENSIMEYKEKINEVYPLFKEKDIDLIVGGGIKNPKDLEGLIVDKVVISSAIEEDTELIAKFISYTCP